MNTKKTIQKSASWTKDEAACATYIEAVDRMYRTGKATEVSYRDALTPLLQALLPKRGVLNEPKPIKCGKPDYSITDGELAVAFVETKKIGAGDLAGKRDSGYKEQFDRYKAALETIAFTDFLDFHFYEKGEVVDSVRIGEVLDGAIRPLSENFAKFVSLVQKMGDAEPQTITSPTQLARLMAAKARLLQVATRNLLAKGKSKASMLRDLMEDFKRVLLPDTNPDEFADIYAQTLTYGMFAARLHDETPETFSRFEAAALIPKSNPFLKKLFVHLASDIDDEILWLIEDIVQLFAAANVAKIMKDYGKSTKQSDPMIHFYEDFLKAYDAGLRKDRGVWYTPLPIVQFIVRAVDDILISRFGIADGLASRDKVEVEVENENGGRRKSPKTLKKVVPKVQILDPATGTGTFLAECVNHIYGRFKSNAGKWPGYVAEDLIPRLNGFEILMASYTMAHIKLDLVLAATGYRHLDDRRFNVFLTNSLEEYKDSLGPLFSMVLGEEANAANAVKRDCPVMVVMGNPPYSGISQNNGKWISDLVADYKTEPGGKEKLKERKHWLNDDYVKFIRLAQDYVERRGEGILAYINNHGLLDNPTFRGMRWRLLDCFDEIYVLNLHGNSMKHEKAPDGGKDENVFSITVGTAINIFVKTGKKKKGELAKVHYADLWGTRKDKFAYLEGKSLANVGFDEVKPAAPLYPFVPKDTSSKDGYDKGFRLDELMPLTSSGIVSMGDSFAYSDTHDEVASKIQDLITQGYTASSLKAKYNLGKNYADFILKFKRSSFDSKKITSMAYRPFDNKWTYFSGDVLWRPREAVMSHFAGHENIGLCCIRICSRDDDLPVFVTDKITDKTILSSKDNANVFPLYLYHDTLGNVEKVANLNSDVVAKIEGSLRTSAPLRETKITPEAIFDYIYAVLHTPEYRERYREFLKVDFPRIPYPTNAATFRKLAKIGGELRELHLMKIKPTASERNRIANFPKGGSNAVEDVRWEKCANIANVANCQSTIDNEGHGAIFPLGRVFINDTQYFDNVPEAAWNMYIGGYQPAQKWLKDRKGRTLSNEDTDHYQEIVFALSRTRALMQKLSALSKEWLD